jgi:hypothetical protein
MARDKELKLAGFDRQEFAYWTTFTFRFANIAVTFALTSDSSDRPLHKGRDLYSATTLYIAVRVRLNDSEGG